MHQPRLFIQIQKIFTYSLFTSFLLFSLTFPSSAQDDTQNQLVNPEHFENILPGELSPKWEKSNFSARTSPSENWGGATYMGDGGAYMQVGLRHYTHDKWKEKKTEAQEDNKAIEIGNYIGYLGEIMGQEEFLVFFGNNFSIRMVGANLTKEDLTALIEQVPLKKINALSDDQNKSTNKNTSNATDSKSLRSIIPDTLSGMMHGRIRTVPKKPILAVTYGNDDLHYSVNIQIAAGEPMQDAKKSLKEELNETNTDLQEIDYKGQQLWFREEESAVSFTIFLNDLVLMISADAPANNSFDKKAARNHLLQAYDQLKTNI